MTWRHHRRRLLALALLVLGCDRSTASAAIYPPAVAYDEPGEFSGTWTGTVGSLGGALEIGEIGEHRFAGHFEDEFRTIEFSLLMEGTMASPAAGGGLAPSNLVTFTWQDGEGGRGLGWLLIDADGTRLTGNSGYRDATEGHAVWTLGRG